MVDISAGLRSRGGGGHGTERHMNDTTSPGGGGAFREGEATAPKSHPWKPGVELGAVGTVR